MAVAQQSETLYTDSKIHIEEQKANNSQDMSEEGSVPVHGL